MKSVAINSKSWHFWIAQQGGFCEWSEQDLCTYLRAICKAVLGGTLFFTALLWCAAEMLWLLGCSIGWCAYFLLNGFIEPNVEIIVIGAGVAVGSFIFGMNWLFRATKRATHKHELHILSAAYSTVKNKVCYRIDVCEK